MFQLVRIDSIESADDLGNRVTRIAFMPESRPTYVRRIRSYSPAAVRTWCAPLATRWQIPLEDLLGEAYGPDLIPDFSNIEENIGHLRSIAAGLDALMPEELQWNFWYRPSVVKPVAPMCRLGWDSGTLAAFATEVESLMQAAARDPMVGTGPLGSLRLFKPAMMFKRLENGQAITHIVCERRPERLSPLSFGPHQTAP